MFSMRFDLRVPGMEPERIADTYRAAIDMAAWADGHEAPFQIGLCEHHASPDGYMPSPLVMASAIAAATRRVPITVAALLLPFYDPVRLAEDMIVLDHLSRGRVNYVLGIGYRPEEYALHDLDYAERGAIAERKLAMLLEALEHAGGMDGKLRVTPPARSPVRRMVAWGGGSIAAVRRAGRYGLNFFGQNDLPGLRQAYADAATSAGHEPGLCFVPDPANPNVVFVAEDVAEAWAEVGPALLHDATLYAAWNTNAGRETISLSRQTCIEDLRAENGAYRIVDVDGAVELFRRWGRVALHPLCGGLDPERAWKYLRVVTESVWPRIRPLTEKPHG